MPSTASCTACANIAIIKYWGKRDDSLNLPLQNSFSVTVDALRTTTHCTWGAFPSDTLVLNGMLVENTKQQRFIRILSQLRRITGTTMHCHVETTNSFPTATGLASSASGMAALAGAAAKALSCELTEQELSALARLGSGSAARSIPGGWCEWMAGLKPDGSDSFAIQRFTPNHWELEIIVVCLSKAPKAMSSSEGMKLCRETSIFWNAFQESVQTDLELAKKSVENKDFSSFAAICERACLRMHAVALGAQPPFAYFTPDTLRVLQQIRNWQKNCLHVTFTMDAGANLILLCEKQYSSQIQAWLHQNAYTTLLSKIGNGILYNH